MVVVYKTSAITYFLGCLLVKVPNIGMVNVVAGRRLCPELIQGAATPEALASAMNPLVGETSERVTMRVGLEEVCRLLGQGGARKRRRTFCWRSWDSFFLGDQTCFMRAVVSMQWMTSAVHPVWRQAPKPRPLSPWKYSWNCRRGFPSMSVYPFVRRCCAAGLWNDRF